MAGDWIKVEENTPDKPEICEMAKILNLDPDAVTGKLIRIWAWASRNCHVDGVTSVTVSALLNRCSGVDGFCEAMLKVGWLVLENDSFRFPNFDRHISEPAKTRALNARRAEKCRNKKKRDFSNAESVTPSSLKECIGIDSLDIKLPCIKGKKDYGKDFEPFWKDTKYPKREQDTKGDIFKKYVKAIKEGCSPEQIAKAADNYAEASKRIDMPIGLRKFMEPMTIQEWAAKDQSAPSGQTAEAEALAKKRAEILAEYQKPKA